jgi:hypothetical protein
MQRAAQALAAQLAASSSAAERIALGLAALESLYVELISALLPENPQFERDRIIRALPRKREIVYVLGVLNEGENEAALILELIGETLARDSEAPTDHLLDEMSYYLRTSVEPAWQLERSVCADSALVYLFAQLDLRLHQIRASPRQRMLEFERNHEQLAALIEKQ